jgi:hypothetical protein
MNAVVMVDKLIQEGMEILRQRREEEQRREELLSRNIDIEKERNAQRGREHVA